jgi:hypothetical protein
MNEQKFIALEASQMMVLPVGQSAASLLQGTVQR